MSRGVDEGYFGSTLRVYSESPDRLGDLSVLLVYNIRLPKSIEKSSLSVVHMAHDSDHRRSLDIGGRGWIDEVDVLSVVLANGLDGIVRERSELIDRAFFIVLSHFHHFEQFHLKQLC